MVNSYVRIRMDTNRHGGHLDLGRMSGSICDGENIHWSTGSRTVISLDRGSQARSKRSADLCIPTQTSASRWLSPRNPPSSTGTGQNSAFVDTLFRGLYKTVQTVKQSHTQTVKQSHRGVAKVHQDTVREALPRAF